MSIYNGFLLYWVGLPVICGRFRDSDTSRDHNVGEYCTRGKDCDRQWQMRDITLLWLSCETLPAKVGESLVHFIMCVTSRVDARY